MPATTDTPTLAPAVPRRAGRVFLMSTGASLPGRTTRRDVAYAPHADAWRSAFRALTARASVRGGRHAARLPRVVVTERLRAEERATYETASDVVLDRGIARLLPADELKEALSSPERDELVVGVTVDAATGVVVLYRGSLDRVVVPTTWFSERAAGRSEQAGAFRLEAAEPADFGQTLRFGTFEFAVDAVLYAFDADVRRRQRERLRDPGGLGASVRRLRLQRGLRQEDVPGLSRREVGRIERGEVQTPLPETMAHLARALGVTAEELVTY